MIFSGVLVHENNWTVFFFFPPLSRHTQERTATLSALAEKAKLTERVLNTVEGISCNPVQGAMYSFPCISIPEKAIKEATVSAQLRHITELHKTERSQTHFVGHV